MPKRTRPGGEDFCVLRLAQVLGEEAHIYTYIYTSSYVYINVQDTYKYTYIYI